MKTLHQHRMKIISQDEAKFTTRVKIKKKNKNFFLFDEKALKVISLIDITSSKNIVFSYQFDNKLNCSYFILVANNCFDVCLTKSFSLFGYVLTNKW